MTTVLISRRCRRNYSLQQTGIVASSPANPRDWIGTAIGTRARSSQRMRKFATALSTVVITAGLSMFSPARAQASLEIVSYWTSDAERMAVTQLEKAYTQRGGTWHFNAINGFDALRSHALDRINLKIAPDVVQWYGGSDLHEISELGAVLSVEDIIGDETILAKIRPELYPDIQHNDRLMALPVGVHFQNTAFYSRSIYQELGLNYPKSWEEFLVQGAKIKEAGYIPLGSSTRFPFYRRLYNAILLAKTDAESFNLLYEPNAAIDSLRDALVESFALFFALKPLTDSGQDELLWHEVVRSVGKNNTAMLLMGDYAQSIYALDGLNAEEHYYCTLAPGNENKWSYGIDIFIFPKKKNGKPTAGQRLFAKTLLETEVQANYISHKGGISAISDASASPNACVDTTQWGDADIALIPDRGSRGNHRITAVNHFLGIAWNKSNYSAYNAADDFIEFIHSTDNSQ